MLTSEGLTAFATASYGVGRPGTALLNLLDYRTRSSAFEAGLSYPVIRSREKNLTLTGLGFLTNDESFTFGQPFTRDRLRGVRGKADGDWADSLARHQPGQCDVQQGLPRARLDRERRFRTGPCRRCRPRRPMRGG